MLQHVKEQVSEENNWSGDITRYYQHQHLCHLIWMQECARVDVDGAVH